MNEQEHKKLMRETIRICKESPEFYKQFRHSSEIRADAFKEMKEYAEKHIKIIEDKLKTVELAVNNGKTTKNTNIPKNINIGRYTKER